MNNKLKLKAGTICYKKVDSKVLFLIIYNERSNNFSFPKGSIKAGESIEKAALRETKEETGSEVCLDRFIEYLEYKNEKGVSGVYYYLSGLIESGSVDKVKVKNVCLEEGDIIIYWLEYEEALKRLSYDSLKKLLEKVYITIK